MSDQATKTSPDPNDVWAEAANQERARWVAAVHGMIREIGGPTGYTREETAQIEILEQLLKQMEETNDHTTNT